MKFSTREDIEAPIDHVFRSVSDFSGFERRARRQGAEVRRIDKGAATIGSTWDVAFKFRGKERKMTAELVVLDPPNSLQVNSGSDGLSGVLNVELVPLSRNRTRIALSVDMRAKSLTARLLLQSMKLAKAKLTKRFKSRVLDFAEDIEDDYHKNS